MTPRIFPVTDWSRWFAWLPVTTQTMFVRRRRWLQFIERRVVIEVRIPRPPDAFILQRSFYEYRDLTRAQ